MNMEEGYLRIDHYLADEKNRVAIEAQAATLISQWTIDKDEQESSTAEKKRWVIIKDGRELRWLRRTLVTATRTYLLLNFARAPSVDKGDIALETWWRNVMEYENLKLQFAEYTESQHAKLCAAVRSLVRDIPSQAPDDVVNQAKVRVLEFLNKKERDGVPFEPVEDIGGWFWKIARRVGLSERRHELGEARARDAGPQGHTDPQGAQIEAIVPLDPPKTEAAAQKDPQSASDERKGRRSFVSFEQLVMELDNEIDVDQDPLPEEVVVDEEEQRERKKVLTGLRSIVSKGSQDKRAQVSKANREAVRLYLDGQTPRQIEKELHSSKDTVKTQLKRGLAQLRRAYFEVYADERSRLEQYIASARCGEQEKAMLRLYFLEGLLSDKIVKELKLDMKPADVEHAIKARIKNLYWRS
jgi:DNA-directed RNA polymerase specialized sigma24 family protein